MTYSPRIPLRSFFDYRPDLLHGSVSSRHILETYLERISENEQHVHAFVALDINAARQEADQSTERYKKGRPLSVLDGCPFAIKDMINTRELPTQMNSPLFSGWHAPVDAACVSALRSGGAIIVGKTVTTPFAAGHTNSALNPHDPNCTPGGSSSGSGAAVGGGMIPLALGTQTRGSLIRPASFCGAVGFKPTLNSIHRGGVHPLSSTLDHVGTISASVADAWAASWLMSSMPGDTSGHQPLGGQPDKLDPMALKKVAVLHFGEWDSAGELTLDELEAVLKLLEKHDCTIQLASEDDELAALEQNLINIIDGHSLDILAYEMRWPFTNYPSEALDSRILDLLIKGSAIDLAHYNDALQNRENLRTAVANFDNRYDAFITLASTGPAPVGTEETGSRHYQVPWTFLGLPTFSLPLLVSENMPVGLQLMGYDSQDHNLSRQALWLTQTLTAQSGLRTKL